MRLAIIIPAYNEQDTLPRLVEKLEATPPPSDPATGTPLDRTIVLVDDGSSDDTASIIKALAAKPGVQAIVHKSNRGKGAAVRSGMTAALQSGADIVLIQDADLEYDPADHGPVLAPILDGRADAVIGTRFIGQTHRVLYFWHYVANRTITLFSNLLTNLNLSDIECCFKAFRREVAERLDLQEDRFGLEPEIVGKLSKMRLQAAERDSEERLRIYEVPVSYSGRTYAEGKKITWKDGVSALRCIVRYGF